jgi:hypothetical protein
LIGSRLCNSSSILCFDSLRSYHSFHFIDSIYEGQTCDSNAISFNAYNNNKCYAETVDLPSSVLLSFPTRTMFNDSNCNGSSTGFDVTGSCSLSHPYSKREYLLNSSMALPGGSFVIDRPPSSQSSGWLVIQQYSDNSCTVGTSTYVSGALVGTCLPDRKDSTSSMIVAENGESLVLA